MNYLKILISIMFLISIKAIGQEKLTLDACRKLVIERNAKVKIADNQIKSSEANTKATERDFYPVIDAQGSYKFLADPMSIDLEGDKYFGSQHLYDLSATLTQNIYSGGMVQLNTKNAKYQEKMAGSNFALTSDELLYQTELRYWQASWAKEANNIAIQYKTLLDELVKVISDKVQTGLVPRNDLLMTEVKQNEAELLIYKTRTQNEVALMELNRIIGNDIKQIISVASSDIYKDYSLPDMQTIEQVLVDRPEVSMQQDKINIDQNNINLVKSKYLPRVFLNLKPIWGAPNTDLLNPDPIFNAAVYASVSMPIIQFGKKHFEVNEKQFGYESSLLEMKDLQDQISLEVNTAYYKLEESIERIKLTEASLEKAKENTDLIEDRYLEGLSPIIELLDAQYSWLLANNAVLDSRLNYFTALAEYKRVIGQI